MTATGETFRDDLIILENLPTSTLCIHMTRDMKIADAIENAFGKFERVVIDVDGEEHEFGADGLIRLLEDYESCGKVPEQAKRENGNERESYGEVCGDDRFDLIGKAKAKLLEATNIEMRPDEMAAIDSILFRCWQMGWLDKLRDDDSRYSELFGTPERAARTMVDMCEGGTFDDCGGCPAALAECKLGDYDALLEWLRGDA